MTPEQITELIAYLQNMGELAVSKGFELAMRQVYVQVMYCGLWLVVAITATIVGIKLVAYSTAKTKEEEYWSEETFWCGFAGWVLIAVSAIAFFFNLGEMLAVLINPEWYAIDLLFGLVTGG